MKRRILSILLILALALSLCACGKEKKALTPGTITPADVNTAVQEMLEQDSVSAKMEVEMGMSIGVIPMSIPVTAEIKKAGDTAYTKATLKLLGQEIGAEVYVEGDWSYTVTGNQKYKIKTGSNEYDYTDDLKNMLKELPEELLKGGKATANADGSQTLTVTIPAEQFSSLFEDYAEGLNTTTGMAGASLTFQDSTVAVTLKEQHLAAYEMDFKATASLAGVDTDLKVTAKITCDAPGTEVVITPPEGYQDFKTI